MSISAPVRYANLTVQEHVVLHSLESIVLEFIRGHMKSTGQPIWSGETGTNGNRVLRLVVSDQEHPIVAEFRSAEFQALTPARLKEFLIDGMLQP